MRLRSRLAPEPISGEAATPPRVRSGLRLAARPEPIVDQATEPRPVDQVEDLAFVGEQVDNPRPQLLDRLVGLGAREWMVTTQERRRQVDQELQPAHPPFFFGKRSPPFWSFLLHNSHSVVRFR